MKTAYIFGSQGHARVIASIIKDKYSAIKFVDIVPTMENVINEKEFFEQFDLWKNGDFFIGIGANDIRTKIYTRLSEFDAIPTNCIAQNTFIAHDAHIGNGVVICPGSVVGTKAIVGNNTIVNTISSVDHDCKVGDNTHIAGGVTLGGTTKIGKNCLLGVKSATAPNVSIGNDCLIMAGSIVYRDVPDKVLVGGNPAKVMRQL